LKKENLEYEELSSFKFSFFLIRVSAVKSVVVFLLSSPSLRLPKGEQRVKIKS
jgi:hypothetical protein